MESMWPGIDFPMWRHTCVCITDEYWPLNVVALNRGRGLLWEGMPTPPSARTMDTPLPVGGAGQVTERLWLCTSERRCFLCWECFSLQTPRLCTCRLPGELTSLSLSPPSLPGGHGAPGSVQGTPSAGETTVKPAVCFRTPRPSQPARPGNPGGPEAAGALTAVSPCPVSCLISRGSMASESSCPTWPLTVRGATAEPWGKRCLDLTSGPRGSEALTH